MKGGCAHAERDEALFEYLRGAVVYGVIRNLMYPAHVHKGYEVLCMLEGELTVYTPMRTLRARPGHIVFIAETSSTAMWRSAAAAR